MEQLQNTDKNEMEQEKRKKAKRVVIALFGICMSIFLTCTGIAIFLIVTFRGKVSSDSHLPDITEIIFFIGVFFAVMGFGYLLPILLKVQKQDKEN